MFRLVNRKDVAVVLMLGWMVVIFYLSHQPASVSSQLSGKFVQLFIKVMSFLPIDIELHTVHFFIRKSAHFTAYFILGLLVMHAIKHGYGLRLQTMIISFLITIIYAISDEFHQTFIPGRSGEVRDILIDSIGSLTGISVYVVLILIYHHCVKIK